MSDATEAEVEAVARALAQLEPGEDWPTNSVLGCDPTITVDDEYRSAMRDLARKAIATLDAVRARSEVEIKAEALREAAEAWSGGPTGFAPIPHEWLLDRAARLIQQEGWAER